MGEIKTKKITVVNERTLLVAIDVSKNKHTGYFRFPDGRDVKPFDFRNDGRGYREVWEYICRTMRMHNLQDVVVGFESTGPYAEPMTHYLRNRGARVVQVNPMHTKRLKELVGNSPGKTDHKDPQVIADIMALGHALTVVVPEGVAADLRRLTHARERAIQRCTALANHLQDLVFVIFPEFHQALKDIRSQTARYLLTHHPTPQDIAACSLEELSHALGKVSRGRFGSARVKALYEAAKTSSGIKEGVMGILIEIEEIMASIAAWEHFVNRLEEEIRRSLKKIPYSHCILSIKGVKEITAAGLIGEVGDFGKFSTLAEIEKLAGLDLYEISSGKHKGRRRISKRGRPLMRKLLFFAALNVVRRGGILHEQYQQCLQRGMAKMKALTAMARKLLRIIYALVRDHSDYVHGYTKIQKLSLPKAA